MSPLNLSKAIDFFLKFNLLENGYNFLNTLTYSIIGLMVYFFVVYPYLLFRKIKINFYFVLSVFVFVVIGSLIISLSLGFYFYYPHLFLFLGLFFLIFLELSLFFAKRSVFSSEKILLSLGLFFLLPLVLLFFINLQNFYFLLILLISFILFIFVYYLFVLFKSNFLKNKISSIALFSQILDASTTFFSVVFIKGNFVEKHLLSNILISLSPYLFLSLKIIFCLLLLFLIDKYIKEKNLNNYFKLFIIILGFSTGLRNLFLISLAFI